MPLISKFKLEDEVLEKLFNLFFEIIGNTDKEEFNLLIRDILSPTERIMIAKRIAIMYLLIKEIDYTIICDKLKVSATTVFKFRFQLEKSDGIVQRFNKILKKEKIAQFLEELYLFLQGPGIPGVNWSAAWKHKLDFERRKQEGI